jgi:hypothetical protein
MFSEKIKQNGLKNVLKEDKYFNDYKIFLLNAQSN